MNAGMGGGNNGYPGMGGGNGGGSDPWRWIKESKSDELNNRVEVNENN